MNSGSGVNIAGNRRRSFFYVWGAALIGIFFYIPAISTLIPVERHLPFSMNVIVILTIVQLIIVTALFAGAGAYLAPFIGLRARFAVPHTTKKSLWITFKSQFSYGVPIGLAGASIAYLVAPEFISYVNKVPFLSRLFCGGLTEEVIIRWGIMTIFVWVLWRVFQKGDGTPKDILVYAGILLSQILFGFGHLPALKMAGVENLYLCVSTIILVSLPWGWLFWKRGLEAAFIAHASFHAFIGIFLALGF